MKFDKKLVAAVILSMASVSAMAADKGDAGQGRGPDGKPGASLELFGLGPFGAHPPKAHGPKGDHAHRKGGKDQRDGKAAAGDDKPVDPASLTEEQRAERFEKHLKARVARVLDKVGGTPEQAEKISAIVTKAHAEIRPMHQQLRELGKRATELFKAEVIDRAAFESLRADRAKLMDSISARANAAWLDVASLLNAEQRAKLAEFQQRKPGHGKHMDRDGRRGDEGRHRGERGERGDRDGRGERGEGREGRRGE
ncbi:MAG: periplasmic heavy metal sensor [Lautropia sp.]|nr:periplasmic heavy metal sensor [Lautropia sp.]